MLEAMVLKYLGLAGGGSHSKHGLLPKTAGRIGHVSSVVRTRVTAADRKLASVLKNGSPRDQVRRAAAEIDDLLRKFGPASRSN